MINPWLCQVSCTASPPNALTFQLNTLSPDLLFCRVFLPASPCSPQPTPPPSHFLHLRAAFAFLNFLKCTLSACGCAHWRAHPRLVPGPAGLGRLGATEHIPFFALGHTPPRSGLVGSNTPRRTSAPERPGRLPIPTGCQNKSSLPVTGERSGGRRRTSWGRRAAVGGQVAGGRSAIASQAAHVPAPEAPGSGARCLLSAQSRRSPPVSCSSRCFSPASPSCSHLLPAPAAGPRRPADLLDHSPRTPLPERCLLSTKLRRPLQPRSRAETKSSGVSSWCLSAPVPGVGRRWRSCCLAAGSLERAWPWLRARLAGRLRRLSTLPGAKTTPEPAPTLPSGTPHPRPRGAG